MAKKEKKVIPSDKLELYQKLVDCFPETDVKSNFGFPYTSLNGHMFSLLSKSGFVGIRLPKEAREQFLVVHNSRIYKPEPGPLLKEYVTIPDDLLNDTESLKKYFELSLAHVKTLKPKKK